MSGTPQDMGPSTSSRRTITWPVTIYGSVIRLVQMEEEEKEIVFEDAQPIL